MTVKIRSAYDGTRIGPTVGGGESAVRQQFKDEVDINNILDRYATTGLMPVDQRKPIFADVSMMQDLKHSMDMIASLEERLKELPRDARELFRKDPQAFAEALQEDVTREKLEELGVLAKPEAPEPAAVPAVPDPPAE